MVTTQVQPTYVGYYLIDSHHRVDEYIERTQQGSKRLFFPVYLRSGEWQWYKSGGQRLCFYSQTGAHSHIKRSR